MRVAASWGSPPWLRFTPSWAGSSTSKRSACRPFARSRPGWRRISSRAPWRVGSARSARRGRLTVPPSSCCPRPIRTPLCATSRRPESSPTRGPATCGSLLSSTTCRTTMSQRSTGSHHSSLTEDDQLLSPPPDRPRSFLPTDPRRLPRIMGEFVEGFDTLSDVRNAVTIFGSARTPTDDPYYEKAIETAKLLAKEGFPIITGGGPGIMEAANRRPQEGNGVSIGCNIEVPHEQGTNPYVERSINFRYVCVREMRFRKHS